MADLPSTPAGRLAAIEARIEKARQRFGPPPEAVTLVAVSKTFDAEAGTGDNVFIDNAWSKATGKLGWPEYRVQTETPPHTVRVFPFRTEVGPAVEDEGLTVLRLHYSHSPNPLPVRRLDEEVIELPGGYILGKAHMKGLRELRRLCFFGLRPAT